MKKFMEVVAASLLAVVVLALLAFILLPAPVKAAGGLGNPGRIVATNMATGVAYTNATVMTSAGLPDGGAVQLNLLALGAGATNSCEVQLQKSVDGTYWTDDAKVQLTGTGATAAKCISNISASAIAYWRIYSVTSLANGTGTNLNVEVWFSKP